MRYGVNGYSKSALFEDGYLGTVCVEAADADQAISQGAKFLTGAVAFSAKESEDQSQPLSWPNCCTEADTCSAFSMGMDCPTAEDPEAADDGLTFTKSCYEGGR